MPDIDPYVDNYEMRVCDWDFSQDQDFSPPGFQVYKDPQPWKDHLRRWVYPWLIPCLSPRVRRRAAGLGLPRDWLLVWGARGQSGRYVLSRINKARSIRGSSVLLLGIGLGRELEFWQPYRPARILGVDVLNFGKAWRTLKAGYPDLDVEFRRIPPNTLDSVEGRSFDIVSSENVLEHVQDLPGLMADCSRVLRPDGILFATFGPLWFSWSGDHFSGERHDGDGFAHLRKDFAAYQQDVRGLPHRDGRRADGRVWILQGLFSRLRPMQYLDICGRHFEIADVRAHLSEDAWRRRVQDPADYARIVERNRLEPWEPLVAGLEILCRKRPTAVASERANA